MQIILLFVIIVSAVILTGVILLQESKGSELGAGFGRGAASGLAGQTPMHGATFLTRLTAILAAVFFASTLALSLFVARDDRDDLLENLGAEQSQPFESTEINGSGGRRHSDAHRRFAVCRRSAVCRRFDYRRNDGDRRRRAKRRKRGGQNSGINPDRFAAEKAADVVELVDTLS